ncbi:hypothetical protein ACFHW2_02710 [Actinomadura sp. LOL_016]|uniref:hypothetical protein n=1 Tax=unclassified Actinomadura TaxID=2626254 RepID=UPI003A8058CA
MTERTRAARWVAAAGRDGPRGRWAGRRLLRAAADGDAGARDGLIEVARTPGHPLHERARQEIAARWVATRDPALREAVAGTGAVAADAPARLVTLALHDRLGEWGAGEAGWAPALLADPDPDVRERAAASCRTATASVHRALWDADTGPGTPLRTVLLENAAPPDGSTLNGLWREWSESPGAEPGDALLRWGRPATDPGLVPLSVVVLETDRDVLLGPDGREALLGALDRDGHPVRDIAVEKIAGLGVADLADEACRKALDDPGLVPLVTEHGLAPRDPVERSVFYVATGRLAQHRALDPDGSLLALGYASADPAGRTRLRDAMTAASDLDLAGVVIGTDRRARMGELTADEARYLAERLAERRAWDELWTIVRDLPLLQGVELVRLIDGWAPRGDADRRLFTAYRETSRQAVAQGLRFLRDERPVAAHRARLPLDGRVEDMSFAPDGPFLAVAGPGPLVRVLDLRSHELVGHYGGFGADPGPVLHVGDGTVLVGARGPRRAGYRLVRRTRDRVETLHTGSGPVTSLARTDGRGGFLAGLRTGEVLRGDRDGVEVLHRGSADDWPRAVAAAPGSGSVAFATRTLYLRDLETGWGAHAAVGEVTRMAFTARGALVCADERGLLTLVRREASGPVLEEVLALAGPVPHPEALDRAAVVRSDITFLANFGGLAVRPDSGEPVVLDRRGGLHVLDPVGLRTLGVRRSPTAVSPAGLAVSPDGRLAAVADAGGHVDLFDLRVRDLPDVLERPMAELLPRHLDLVGAALADSAASWGARGPLRLVQASLDHRFRSDVEIGDAVRLAGDEYDIGL